MRLERAWWWSSKLAAESDTIWLTGRLVLSSGGWLLLEVPNAFVRGAFSALSIPGIELPTSGSTGQLKAHISVMRKEEVDAIGKKISETGKLFRYRLGRLHELRPYGWPEMEKVWLMRVHSPELSKLRVSYGLPPLPVRNRKTLPFHITVAVRRKGVLQIGTVSKLQG